MKRSVKYVIAVAVVLVAALVVGICMCQSAPARVNTAHPAAMSYPFPFPTGSATRKPAPPRVCGPVKPTPVFRGSPIPVPRKH